jgi:uncharacterized membrane protein
LAEFAPISIWLPTGKENFHAPSFGFRILVDIAIKALSRREHAG